MGAVGCTGADQSTISLMFGAGRNVEWDLFVLAPD